MNYYESIVIVRQSTGEEDLKKIINRIKGIIEKGGGEFIEVKNWGKRKLAYEVKKEKKGVYLSIHFKGERGVTSELEKAYRLYEKILKYLTIKLDRREGKKEKDKEEPATPITEIPK